MELPDMEWCIESLLPKGKIMMLGGPPKKGKSRLILDTVLRGVRGSPAFGQFRQDYKRVLIYNAEGGVQAIKMRSRMFDYYLQGKMGSTGIGKALLKCISVTSERPQLTNQNGTINETVLHELAEAWVPFDLVVMDPLVSFHTADENNNQQMGNLLDALRDVTESVGTSLIIVHHTGKVSSDETQISVKQMAGMKLRGASAIHGAVDSAVMAYPTQDGMSLVYDLRYAENPGESHVVGSRVTGRFFRKIEWTPKTWLADPEDFSREHGYNPELYQRSFGLTPSMAESIMIKAKEDAQKAMKYVLKPL